MASRPKLGELLIEAGVIDEDQLAVALERHRELDQPLGKTLLEMEALDEETLLRTLARQLGVPVVWLRGKRVQPEVLGRVPWELVEKHRCLPVHMGRDHTLLLAVEDPTDPRAAEEVGAAAGVPVRAVLASPSELSDAIRRHTPADPDQSAQRMEFLEGEADTPDLLTVEPPVDAAVSSGREPEPAEPGGGSDGRVLRALSQLLVEKGVITREELIERLEKLGGESG